MRQRIVGLATVLGLLVVGLVAVPASAQAAQTVEPAPSPAGISSDGPVTVLRGCNVRPAPGVSGVNARRAPNQGAVRNGIIQAGQVADADCTATAGGAYTCPRGSSTWWIRVTWPAGVTSYVAERCVIWNVD
jgi:hypothetical protein